MLENHSYSQVIGKSSASFLNELARRGALFTNSRAITHPSQPDYLALFSVSTQGVTGDDCPQRFTGPNLASELLAAGYTPSLSKPLSAFPAGNFAALPTVSFVMGMSSVYGAADETESIATIRAALDAG